MDFLTSPWPDFCIFLQLFGFQWITIIDWFCFNRPSAAAVCIVMAPWK